LIIGGFILLVLGIIAEYVGLLVRTAIGRPLYVITNDRADGPLYRD
jgi:undecaprenyl-phosphate 4-deoxy-4-formamido-L-arabinose transferase